MRCFYALKKWSSAKLSLNRDCTVLQVFPSIKKTVFFFNQIELVFQEKVNFSSTENAQFEKFQNPSEQQGTAMTNKRPMNLITHFH